jgi:thiamine pyrophosphokinase
MNAVLIGNAAKPPKEYFLESIKEAKLLIAADGGARFCEELGVVPNMIIGDFDSLSPELIKKFETETEIKKFPKDKNETDLKLALSEAVRRGVSKLRVFSWADSRIDYSLGTLIDFSQSSLNIELVTEESSVFILNKTQHTFHIYPEEFASSKISIYPLQNPTSLKSNGLKWELDWKSVNNLVYSQSNEVLEACKIELSEGSAFLVLNRS